MERKFAFLRLMLAFHLSFELQTNNSLKFGKVSEQLEKISRLE